MHYDKVHTPTINENLSNANVILMSHVGAVRDENQDYRGFHSFGNAHLVIVADGMGGHSGGFEASRLAVNAMVEFVTQNWGQQEPQSLLEQSIIYANQVLQDFAQANVQYSNMGTTIVVVLCFNNNIWLAHVGDSRAYVIRKNQMHLVSFDHTRVNRMLQEGMITYENTENHPMGHILERSVGINPMVEPEVRPSPIQIQQGDILLLCSDGLWGSITEADMIRIVNQSSHINVAAESMLNLALRNQADDNVTLALFEYTAPTEKNLLLPVDVRDQFRSKPVSTPQKRQTVIIPPSQRLQPPPVPEKKNHLKWIPIPILLIGILLILVPLFRGEAPQKETVKNDTAEILEQDSGQKKEEVPKLSPTKTKSKDKKKTKTKVNPSNKPYVYGVNENRWTKEEWKKSCSSATEATCLNQKIKEHCEEVIVEDLDWRPKCEQQHQDQAKELFEQQKSKETIKPLSSLGSTESVEPNPEGTPDSDPITTEEPEAKDSPSSVPTTAADPKVKVKKDECRTSPDKKCTINYICEDIKGEAKKTCKQKNKQIFKLAGPKSTIETCAKDKACDTDKKIEKLCGKYYLYGEYQKCNNKLKQVAEQSK